MRPAIRELLLGAYDPDALAWRAIVRVGGGDVSPFMMRLVSNLIRALKAAGVWTLLDRLWLFAAENAQQALIDLVARSTATAVNSPTFTANQGYAGNGTSSYVDTSFNLSTASNFAQNSAHMGVWRRVANSTAGAAGLDGVLSSPAVFSQFVGGSSTAGQIIILGAGPGFPTVQTGYLLGSRTAANISHGYLNGVDLGNDATASAPPPNQRAFVGAVNNGGTPAGFGNHQTLAVHWGGGLTATQAAAMFSALGTYKTAVGA